VPLKVVGAGVGRTGTESLKLALEQLLGGRCYHMLEVIGDAQRAVPFWAAAGRGDMPDWDAVFEGYVAAVDWPVAAYWPEIRAAYPDALVLLSTRATAEDWYRSASATIFKVDASIIAGEDGKDFAAFFTRFTTDVHDPAGAMAAYEAHNARVRAEVPASRLLEWQPGDGWAPICSALGLPEPDEPFPHVNTTKEFQERLAALGLGDGAPT
jgi:hypothetical protein